jgi:Flp pilus assembly pilin Flp
MSRDAGQGLTEYAVVIALVAVILGVALLFVSMKIDDRFRRTGEGVEQPVLRPPVQCDTNYTGACVPAHPPDLDCSDLRGMGIALPVRVAKADPHHLDPDGDGFGC